LPSVFTNTIFEYVHDNPVKHGYITKPFDWKHVSIHEFAKQGLYEPGWGAKEEITIVGDFGE